MNTPHPATCTCLFCANGRPTESFIEWQRRLSDAPPSRPTNEPIHGNCYVHNVGGMNECFADGF